MGASAGALALLLGQATAAASALASCSMTVTPTTLFRGEVRSSKPRLCFSLCPLGAAVPERVACAAAHRAGSIRNA